MPLKEIIPNGNRIRRLPTSGVGPGWVYQNSLIRRSCPENVDAFGPSTSYISVKVKGRFDFTGELAGPPLRRENISLALSRLNGVGEEETLNVLTICPGLKFLPFQSVNAFVHTSAHLPADLYIIELCSYFWPSAIAS